MTQRRRPDYTSRYPVPVTVRIRCSGELHRITFDARGVRTLDHTKDGLKLIAALRTPCKCLDLVTAVRVKDQSGHRARLGILPDPIRKAFGAWQAVKSERECGWWGWNKPETVWNGFHEGLLTNAANKVIDTLLRPLAKRGFECNGGPASVHRVSWKTDRPNTHYVRKVLPLP